MATRIGIVNYGMGNLRSVEKALERVGGQPLISGEPAELDAVAGLVLPGVGAFPRAMKRIRESALDAYLRARVEAGTPVLGVCLGMQLLFESSTENGGARGLGLLSGPVTELEAPERKLPHIGWSPVRVERETALTEGLAADEPFYFVHSFVPRPESGQLLASAEYGDRFAAVVGRPPVYGAQFHPEKSSAAGLLLLANFIAICQRHGNGVATTTAALGSG
ncbi:MAG: imidazole glycerol phosphate synthase subunit HisH [Solirubrobacterales bacterium]